MLRAQTVLCSQFFASSNLAFTETTDVAISLLAQHQLDL